MNLFEQFIFTYFISSAAIAGVSVLWRNWLADHPRFKERLRGLGAFGEGLTCGLCFTFWLTLLFIITTNPLQPYFSAVGTFINFPSIVLYGIAWMAIGWLAVVLRFLCVLLQENVGAFIAARTASQKS